MKKNDITELEITDVTLEGSGVGRHEGIAVFVPFTAVGDRISCRIVKVCRSYCFGIIEKLISPSPYRTDRGCAAYGKCGGCTFRHISYEEEARLKQHAVREMFTRIGGFDPASYTEEDIIGADMTDRCRNKAQYPVAVHPDGTAYCGFFAQRSHRVIECEDCLLQPQIFSDIAQACIAHINRYRIPVYDEVTGKGIVRHIYIRQGYHTGEIMLCIVAARRFDMEALAAELAALFPRIRSFILNINSDRTNVIMGEKCITVRGSSFIEDIMCGRRIRLSPLSFYQVNTAQAERLYAKAQEYVEPAGKDILDLYCGAGTIGLSMEGFARLTGAEIVPQAVENAHFNAQANNIANAEFFCADAGETAKRLADEGRLPDVIITDPPRKGCDEQTIDAMVQMHPERIVMVSCDPSTAARDCRRLADKGYTLQKLCTVDLYPGTKHVETVCLLGRST